MLFRSLHPGRTGPNRYHRVCHGPGVLQQSGVGTGRKAVYLCASGEPFRRATLEIGMARYRCHRELELAGCEGKNALVEVYSNADQVELCLNAGRSGKRKSGR